jgi:hypothetical protein
MANASVTHELRVVALDGKTLVYKFTPRYGQVKVTSYKLGVADTLVSAYYEIQAARRLYTLIQRKNRAPQTSFHSLQQAALASMSEGEVNAFDLIVVKATLPLPDGKSMVMTDLADVVSNNGHFHRLESRIIQYYTDMANNN